MAWWAIGASLFASNIGTEHFVGQAGSAAGSILPVKNSSKTAEGMPIGFYEWSAVYLLLLLGWVFGPVYLRCELTTVPQYFEQR